MDSLWSFVFAAAVEDGEGGAVFDESADDDVVAALHVGDAEHHII